MNLKEKFDAGYVIQHNEDNTIAVQVIKRKTANENPYIIEWSDGVTVDYNDSDEGKFLTCTPPKKRVTTNLVIDNKGNAFVTGSDIVCQNGKPCIKITTEEQPDGSWKII